MNVRLTLVLATIPGVMIILSFFRLFQRARINNYQSRLIQAMFVMTIVSSTLLIVEFDRNPYILFAFVPLSAFFIGHFFTLTKRGFFGELTFILFVGMVWTFNFQSLNNANQEGMFDIQSYFVNSPNKVDFEGKKIAVFDDQKSAYSLAIPATPFIDWRLSEKAWSDTKKYKNLSIIAGSIDREKPEVILDPNGYFRKLLLQAPGLGMQYELKGNKYYLIPSN